MFRFISLLSVILSVRLLIFYFYPPSIVISKSPLREVGIFSQIKLKISNTYSAYLGSKDSKLLMGVVFGSKDLDKSSNQKYISTGVLHVVAASGMNVSMLTSVLLGTLVLFLARKKALIITGIILLFYTALADFQPSIVRAAIMGLLALGAGLYGRQNTSFVALFFAAFLMIFWDPAILISVSFILSFSATLGIILLDPLLRRIARSSVFEDLRTTLAAQIATTPILLFFFGTSSPISIPVNFLVLWTIPPLMVLGGIAAVLGLIAPILAAPFVYLSLPLLSYFNGIVDLFASDTVAIELKNIPWAIVAGYYLIVLAGIVWINKKINSS